MGDSLVRAATTASSLEVEQDIGNINKTQSKATPNESSSLGTISGGGPRGNTLRSDEDRLKLDELMALYEEITLVSVQNVDEEMFDVNVLDVKVINITKLITDSTTVSAATTTTATITIVDDITLA
ncbi:hypothetical protein Tco_0125413 [Tanacetum coccineum]